MKEVNGNMWDFHKGPNWVCVTTNGFTRKDGAAVMGRGVAKQAAKKFPDLPYLLGSNIKQYGNEVFCFPYPYQLFTLPVKHKWWEQADVNLIKRSISALEFMVNEMREEKDPISPNSMKVFLPRPGCGNGGLRWEDIKPLIKHLDDRFTVVELYG